MTLPISRNAISPFDLLAGQGQLNYTFVFKLVNATTGMFIRYLTPLTSEVPRLSHDTTQTVKRSVTLTLGVSDTAAIDTIHHRVLIYLQLADGTQYPLGRFMFTDNTRLKSTGGNQSSMVLMDEEFIIDQPSTISYPPFALIARLTNAAQTVAAVPAVSVEEMIKLIILQYRVGSASIDSSPYQTSNAWSIGTTGMQILSDLAAYGDYFPPWIDASNTLRMIRSFDPSQRPPKFDWDQFPHVYADSVTESDDLLTAPNSFTVVGNGAATTPALGGTGGNPNLLNGAIVGTYNLPASAPHSIQNRGFTVPLIAQVQVDTQAQASALARSIGIQSTLYQRTTVTTFPDPRHDSFDVIRWQGSLWLELAWSMDLIAGGNMDHMLRKVYAP
jgi:hypothetical protein